MNISGGLPVRPMIRLLEIITTIKQGIVYLILITTDVGRMRSICTGCLQRRQRTFYEKGLKKIFKRVGVKYMCKYPPGSGLYVGGSELL